MRRLPDIPHTPRPKPPKSPFGDQDVELVLGTGPDGPEIRVPVRALDRHAHYIGMTGGGKTYGLYRLFQELALKTQSAMIFLDWKGDAYDFLKRWCYQKSFHRRGRLVLIDPGETRLIPGLNPLRPWTGNLLAQAEAMADVILRTMGDEAFDRPQVSQWTANLMFLLLASGLTFYEAARLLAPDSPLRDAAIPKLPESVNTDDWEFFQRLVGKAENVGALRILNEIVGPVSRRVRRYVANETVARMLASPTAIDWTEVLADRKIVLVNLGAREGFEQNERRLLGMQIITELVRTSFRHEGDRLAKRPCYFFLDECQNFLCPDLTEILETGRGMNLRLILAHQTINQLTGKDGDRSLWNLVNECTGFKAVFHVKMGGDTSKVLAESVYGPTLDLMREKRRLTQKKQLSEVVDVVDTTYSQSQTRMEAKSETDVEATGGGTVSGAAQGQVFGPEKGMFLGGEEVLRETKNISSGSSEFSSSAHGQAFTEAEARTQGVSFTKRKAVHPTEPFDEVMSIEGMSVEEQLFEKAQWLAKKKTAHCVLKWDDAPVDCVVPHIHEPAVSRRRVKDLDLLTMRQSAYYLPPEEIDRAIEARQDALLGRESIERTPVHPQHLPQKAPD